MNISHKKMHTAGRYCIKSLFGVIFDLHLILLFVGVLHSSPCLLQPQSFGLLPLTSACVGFFTCLSSSTCQSGRAISYQLYPVSRTWEVSVVFASCLEFSYRSPIAHQKCFSTYLTQSIPAYPSPSVSQQKLMHHILVMPSIQL